MKMINELRIDRWGAMPALAMTPLAQVNLLTGPNGIGKTAALEATAELVRSGELEEPPEGPPRLVHRVGNGRERWHAEADLACPPGRRPGTRGPVRQVEEPRSAPG